MPAPEAPSAAADSAALEAQDPEEPAVPDRARLVAKVVLARLPVLVRVVLEAAVVVEHLLSRQSLSAAMARSTP